MVFVGSVLTNYYYQIPARVPTRPRDSVDYPGRWLQSETQEHVANVYLGSNKPFFFVDLDQAR